MKKNTKGKKTGDARWWGSRAYCRCGVREDLYEEVTFEKRPE